MNIEHKIEIKSNDGKWAALLGVVFFVILFSASLLDHRYALSMRYVSYGMFALIEFVALYAHQVGNITIELTNEEFVFKSMLKRRTIPYTNIKSVTLIQRNSIVDAIVNIEVHKGPNFRFDRYNIDDTDINQIIEELQRIC